jgi:hypothetical protein
VPENQNWPTKHTNFTKGFPQEAAEIAKTTRKILQKTAEITEDWINHGKHRIHGKKPGPALMFQVGTSKPSSLPV